MKYYVLFTMHPGDTVRVLEFDNLITATEVYENCGYKNLRSGPIEFFWCTLVSQLRTPKGRKDDARRNPEEQLMRMNLNQHGLGGLYDVYQAKYEAYFDESRMLKEKEMEKIREKMMRSMGKKLFQTEDFDL